MLFCSLSFLFIFFPLCLFFYFIARKEVKNVILLLFSLIFYAWGEPKYILLMLITVFVSYLSGLCIHYFDKKQMKKLKLFSFVISIVIILASLIYFKYFNFIIENMNSLFSLKISAKTIVLPIGISFYTFQILSYIIDLYRNKIKVQKSYFDLALYISFFPQLIAGPIVQYETIEEQLSHRKESFSKIVSGLERFLIGLGKKVLIANQMALIADTVFNSQTLGEYSATVLLVGILSYTFQIYFDFSGYSDMAIGLARIFGFEFKENFNYPYISKSITEFWRRWHISLSSFFRDYIYIPLGGNRVSKLKWIRNMMIVWLLTGLWHGAAWNFVVWGIYYGILLILEKIIFKNILEKVPNIVRLIITFILINIGWTIFRVNEFGDLKIIFENIITNKGNLGLITFMERNPSLIYALPHIFIAFILCGNIGKKLNEQFQNNRIYNIGKKILLLGILVLSISSLVSSQYNPFIYFRF